jgi:proteic killer suppression protein
LTNESLMIETFKDKALKLLFEKGDSSKIRTDLLRKVENLLTRLDAAKELKDMNAPGLNLHELKGDRKGTWSVTLKTNWRITFRFENENVFDVKLEDYH